MADAPVKETPGPSEQNKQRKSVRIESERPDPNFVKIYENNRPDYGSEAPPIRVTLLYDNRASFGTGSLTPNGNRHSLNPSKSDLFLWTRKNLSIAQKLRISTAELLGSAIYTFIGCTGCMPGKRGQIQDTEMVSFVLGFGFMISYMIFSHVSMGHFNPILSIAAFIVQVLSVDQLPLYLFSQFCGTMLGYSLAYFVAPHKKMYKTGVYFCVGVVNNQVEPWQGFICEFMISFMLCMFCCVAWYRYMNTQDSLALTLGVVIVALSMAGVEYTEAHMNPFKTCVAAILNNKWANHWVYWAGPVSGCILAAVLFRAFLRYIMLTKLAFIY